MRVLILGITGNVGQQALKVVQELNYELVGFSFFSNANLAIKIKNRFNIDHTFSSLAKEFSTCSSILSLIKKSNPDIIINAISGIAGLKPLIWSLKSGKTVANANKESFVVAGLFINKLAKKYKTKIIPLDSEHAAIHELIKKFGSPDKIFLTGSGGPFYNFNNQDLTNISVDRCLVHPKWNMGAKITVASATHMNKCLEMIEAFWLFQTKQIYPIFHPEAMVHSLVETKSKIFGLESSPNMSNPIRYALCNCSPNVQGEIKEYNFNQTNYTLKPFRSDIKPLKWATEIINSESLGKAIILNAANELAVEYFLEEKIPFLSIYEVIEFALKNIGFVEPFFLFQVTRLHNKTQRYLIKNFFKK